MGHYTSYAKHMESEDWYFYNDETATKTVPGQEDNCNAYILFYKKQGMHIIYLYYLHIFILPCLDSRIFLIYFVKSCFQCSIFTY